MCIRHPSRSSSAAGPLFLPLLVLAVCCGCNSSSSTEGDITAGVWRGSAGPEDFFWEIWEDSLGLGGVVHTVRDGKKRTELPIDRVVWQFPELETQMDVTGVTYRGRVDFDRGRIKGRLFYGEEAGPEMDLHLDFFRQVLEREVLHEPGTHWAYHSANVNLLAGVIKEATGQHADVFAEENLFRPLGIAAYDWSSKAEDGYRLMDGSLHLRPRDMAKLGMLLRDEGRWQDQQVVSADWIRQSIAAQIATDGPEQYGYLWWLGESPSRDGVQPAVLANGRGSQFIAWLPERDLILVVTGGNDDNGKHFAIKDVLGEYL